MMDQPPELLPFLDRRHELKGANVTEQPKKRTPKEKKAVLRLVVEFDHDGFDMEEVKAIVEKAREQGTIRAAKLSGLPTSTDLS